MTREASHWLKPPGPVAPGLSIGLLGGSFNPPHEGHLHISEMALKRLGLDYVWWLVAPQNPLKSTRDTAPLDKRIALATKLVDERRVIVTDAEHTLGLGINDELGQTFGTVESHGAAGCSPGELCDFDFAIFFLCLSFG